MVNGEELLTAFIQSLEEELHPILETHYAKSHQEYIKEPVHITYRDTPDMPRLPSVFVTITKNRLRREDRHIDRGEFTLTCRITFAEGDPPVRGHRYHLVLSELLRTTTILREKADQIILEEMDYHPEKMIGGEPGEAEFSILLICEEWIPF